MNPDTVTQTDLAAHAASKNLKLIGINFPSAFALYDETTNNIRNFTGPDAVFEAREFLGLEAPPQAGLSSTVVLRREHDLTPFASRDRSRYVLNGVFFDAEEKMMVATDGRHLVRCPIQVDTDSTSPVANGENAHSGASAIIPTDSLKSAMKALEKAGEARMEVNGKITMKIPCDGGAKTVESMPLCGQYPDYKAVVKKHQVATPVVKIALNPAYMRDIMAYAARNTPSGGSIVLEITSSHEPLFWSCQTASGTTTGLLMPMRMDT